MTTHQPQPISATDATEKVAIVGMGIVVPNASSAQEFWQLLEHGEPVFTEAPDRYPLNAFFSAEPDTEDQSYARTSGFLTRFVPCPEVTAEIDADRFSESEQHPVWLRHCLTQAKTGVAARRTDRFACYIGTSIIASQRADEAILVESVAHQMACRLGTNPGSTASEKSRLHTLLREHFGHPTAALPRFLPDAMVASAIAGLVGPDCEVGVVDAACSSSLYAVDLGAKALIAGDCDIAYCGGVSGVSPRYNVGFAKLHGLTRSGRVRVFDATADGTLFSDGAAVVTLKLLDRAITDNDQILGVLAGFGGSSDGRGKAIYAPNPVGQRLCIERGRRAAGLTCDDVDWTLAHATGTPAGDSVELRTLADTAPATGQLCTSNKSLIGHTGWSAGIVSVVHLLLALRGERIPAQRQFRASSETGDHAGGLRIPRQSTPWPADAGRPRIAGVSAFGFGGANAHLLIQDYRPGHLPRNRADRSLDPLVLVAWSAHLPGDPTRAQVESLLASGGAPPIRRFDGGYPIPPFSETRLPPATARAVDYSQLMALHVAAMFVTEHGEMWAPVRETTGVFAAQTGPVPSSADHLIRCYATDLGAFFTGTDAPAFASVLDQARAATPPTTKDTLPGLFPNILAARLANRYDLHGPTMAVDTGRNAALTAIGIAARYLRTRELDLALLLGLNANTRPDLAELVGINANRLAEGAFLLAFSRQEVARARGWPILAHIDLGPVEPGPATISNEAADAVSYLGADGAVAMLRALYRTTPSVLAIPGSVGGSRRVRVTPAQIHVAEYATP